MVPFFKMTVWAVMSTTGIFGLYVYEKKMKQLWYSGLRICYDIVEISLITGAVMPCWLTKSSQPTI